MRATTEFFKMPRDGVIPPGEGVMGVTMKAVSGWEAEQALRDENDFVHTQRDYPIETASEGKRCETCGGTDPTRRGRIPSKLQPAEIGTREYPYPSHDCPDPFHTASERERCGGSGKIRPALHPDWQMPCPGCPDCGVCEECGGWRTHKRACSRSEHAASEGEGK